MKTTIRNSVGETYKKTNNNYQFNGNLDKRNNNNTNTSNNINVTNMNSMNSMNNTKNNFNNTNSFNNSSNQIVRTSNNMLYLILFIIFASIVGLIIFFKDKIVEFINRSFENKQAKKENDDLEDLRKKLNDKDKEINDIKMGDKIKNDKENIKNKLPENNKKANEELKKLYSEKQFVKENSFCYIGDDDNMRHCIETYNGDICESGDVYNRIDECLMPKKL